MIGFHIQDESVQEWDKAASELPDSSWCKFVNNHSAARVLWETATGKGKIINNIFRQWADDLQQFPIGGSMDFYRNQAETIIARFLNPTFLDNAYAIRAVESYNETLAVSQTDEEVAERVKAEEAFAFVWDGYRRLHTELSHIAVCHLNTAVGNNMYGPSGNPAAFARIANAWGGYLGYHPYIAVYYPDQHRIAYASVSETEMKHIDIAYTVPYRANFRQGSDPYIVDNIINVSPEIALLHMALAEEEPVIMEPSPGEWDWASGRWTHMDTVFKSYGYNVRWLFTEGGPVRDYNGRGALDPLGGWKLCLRREMDRYTKTLAYWADRTAAWNKNNDNRAASTDLFTVPGHDQWSTFGHNTSEMYAIAEFANAYTPTLPPDPDPDPDPEPECKGEPREDYRRIVNVAPEGATSDEAIAIFTEGWLRGKETTGGSYDDAGIGNLTKKQANLYGIEIDRRQIFLDWYQENYPGTTVRFRYIPEELDDTWHLPLGELVITDQFTYPNQPLDRDYDDTPGYDHRHEGTDFHCELNDPVYAMRTGKVIWSSNKRRSDSQDSKYGEHIVIEHEDGYVSWYAHLNNRLVQKDSMVLGGTLIGQAGWSGNVYPPGPQGTHLHLSIQHIGYGFRASQGYVLDWVTDPMLII